MNKPAINATLSSAFKDSIPVLMGYLPLGAAFGLLWVNAGFEWYWATIMSIFVFAGALQFIAVTFLAAGMPLWEIALSTLIINFRHIFYGLSYPQKQIKHPLIRLYGMFSLTDESYSLLAGKDHSQLSEKQIFTIQALNQSYWVCGATLGAVIGGLIPEIQGIDFALTALFIVLMMEHAYKKQNHKPLAFAALSAIGAIIFSWLTNTQQFLTISMFLFVVLLLAAYHKKGTN